MNVTTTPTVFSTSSTAFPTGAADNKDLLLIVASVSMAFATIALILLVKLLERCLPREVPRVEMTQQQKAERVAFILEKYTKMTTYADWILAERIKHHIESATPSEVGAVIESHGSSEVVPAITRELSARLASSPKEEEVWATDCAVCLSEFANSEQVRELPCDHIFHDGCIESWFMKARTAACPLCRNLLHSEVSQEQIVRPVANAPPASTSPIILSPLEVV